MNMEHQRGDDSSTGIDSTGVNSAGIDSAGADTGARDSSTMTGSESVAWPPEAGDPHDATWTEIGDDLSGTACPPDIADIILRTRLAFASGDMSRVPYWRMPEEVDAITDIPYIDDGVRGHLLDVYLPHDAVVRGGHSLPVFVDIHGGGFVYGYKELNRNFCVQLADRGFAVVSLNYRPAPQTDFIGQLRDIGAAFSWMDTHLVDYPVDARKVFLTGDSAGGTLALYTAAIMGSDDMAHDYGVARAHTPVAGMALVSGLYDLAPYLGGRPSTGRRDARTVLDILGPMFFGGLSSIDDRHRFFDDIVSNVTLPPSLLITSSDDFLEAETLELAACLSRAGRDMEVRDCRPDSGTTLGHVFSVCMSWLPESRRILDDIRDFAYRGL